MHAYYSCLFHCSSKPLFTGERIEQLRQLAASPDIYERLAKALGMYAHVVCMAVINLSCISCIPSLCNTYVHVYVCMID